MTETLLGVDDLCGARARKLTQLMLNECRTCCHYQGGTLAFSQKDLNRILCNHQKSKKLEVRL